MKTKIFLPKNFATIYDNGGETLDRYTIVFNNTQRKMHGKMNYDCICASENGSGVFMWGECSKGSHLGIKINFSDLSKQLQSIIINNIVFSDTNDEAIEYGRKPTAYEIKFGEGAMHHKSFDKFYCANAKGDIKKRIICPIDGLIYTRNL